MTDTLFLDPVGGIAGDMFLAACLDLGVSQAALEQELSKLGVRGFKLRVKRDHEASIAGLHVDVDMEGEQPHERGYVEIIQMIEACALSAKVKETAGRIFRAIGEAEAHVHHKSLETIHFHEVGAIDSIVDICGAAICLELLGWPKLLSAPPPAGAGTTSSMHGIIPIPPPATLQLMRGRRMRPSGPGERTTPTGAGILAALAEEVPAMPDLVIERVGYGVGTKRWEDAPNVLRAVLGRAARNHGARSCVLVEANLDDTTGQILARALDVTLEAGALDAWLTPIVGKKGRPGHILSALVEHDALAAVQRVIFTETPTLGLRTTPYERTVLDREWHEVETPWGRVRVKLGRLGGQVINAAPEHDDCLRLARESAVPLKRVIQVATAAAERFFGER
jgi:uncharacterized protein (TIGR00299 family) protein